MNPKRLPFTFLSCVFAVVALVAQAADPGLPSSHPVARDVPLIPRAVLDAVVGCQGSIVLRGEVSGGGCLVDKEKKLVLTAMHVVVPMGWRKGSRIVLPKPLSISFDVINPQTLQTTSLLVEHVYHFEGDLALVRVSRVPSWMKPARIAQSEVFDTLVGRELYAVSYRFDTLYGKKLLFRLPSRGVVLDIPLGLDPQSREADMHYAYMAAPVEPGSSGLPYFDASGSIVGVTRAMIGQYSLMSLVSRIPPAMRWDGTIPPLEDFQIRQ